MAKTRQKKEKDVLDQLLDSIDFRGLTQDEMVGKDGLIKQLTGRILQRALEAEMTEHLGYEKNSNSGDNTGNSRNGHTEKTVLLENPISVPRDRAGTSEPIIVPKHEKRVPLFNDQIISMYGRGMTDREIRGHLEEIYDIEVSPDLISRVTYAVLDEVRGSSSGQILRHRVFGRASRQGPHGRKKPHEKRLRGHRGEFRGEKGGCGLKSDGLWIAETEGAKFWMGVLTELKNRGVQDILIACMDGLSEFPDAVRAVYPQTRV